MTRSASGWAPRSSRPSSCCSLYVQFHGDLGPGGGFQAGVIVAADFVLYALVYGLATAQRVLPPLAAYWAGALGVMIYAGTGVVSLFKGGAFMDYDVLLHDPLHGQHWGISGFRPRRART